MPATDPNELERKVLNLERQIERISGRIEFLAQQNARLSEANRDLAYRAARLEVTAQSTRVAGALNSETGPRAD
jgi:hypothetical protein